MITINNIFKNNIFKHVLNLTTFINNKKRDYFFKQKLISEKKCFIGSNVVLDSSFQWLISIGNECTITSRTIILAHDASTKKHLGYAKIGKVSIGDKTFIGAGSIILPGTQIGNNVIIGAGSVVTKNIPDNSIAVGNPAIVIGSTSEYMNKHKLKMELRPIYENGWTLESEITEEKKEIMKTELESEIGYII